MSSLLPKVNFGLFKSSILYSIAEGASKGGFQILLLVIASFIANDIYLVLMLLLGLEALLKMMYVTFYGNVLYKLVDIFPSKSIFNVVFVVSVAQLFLFVVLLFLFREYLFDYYNYSSIWIFLILSGNAFVANLSVYYSVILQLEEKHGEAVKYRSTPFFLGFIGALIGVFIAEDKVLGFFLGKFVGFQLFFLIFLVNKLSFSSIKIKIIRPIFSEMKGRVVYSFFIAVMGWLSTLGFMYIAKIWSSDQDLVILGYIINLYNVLFLFGYGINQVYSPRIKYLIVSNNFARASNLKKKILALYLVVAMLMMLGLFTINRIIPIETFLKWKLDNVGDILSVGYYSILIFIANAFNWIVSPFYFSMDRFRQYFYYTAVSLILAFGGFYLGYFIFMINLGLGYAIFHLIKNLIPFLAINYRLNGKE